MDRRISDIYERLRKNPSAVSLEEIPSHVLRHIVVCIALPPYYFYVLSLLPIPHVFYRRSKIRNRKATTTLINLMSE